MSIIKFIEKYKKEKRLLFTTPSHSQGAFIPPYSKKLLGDKFFSCDFSENDGFDNLAAPSGIIKAAQDKAARIYGVKASFFLTNGSTSGIIAAMLAVLNKNDKVIIARNCHRAVYNGLVLTGAVPIWLMPDRNPEWDIYSSIDTGSLEELLRKNKDVKAVIITNPSYEGIIYDMNRIAALCRKYKAFLIADEAHGALWTFDKTLGTPAASLGADITVQSLHKTAGALNPSAILHISNASSVPAKKIQQALNLINTSSPSYPLLLNIEAAIDFLSSKAGAHYLQNYTKNIRQLISSLKKIPNLDVYSGNNDITKILVKVKNMSGIEFSEIMSERYGIEDELANDKSVLYLTGIGTSPSKLKKFEKALAASCSDNIKIDVEHRPRHEKTAVLEPRVRYTPAAVWNKPYREVEIKYAAAQVSMELIAEYPPGAPLIIPGEALQKEHIEYLTGIRKKIKVLA